MFERIIPKKYDRTTVEVGGDVVKVSFEGAYRWVFVRHISGEILCSACPNIADGADGVSKLSDGGCRLEPPASAVYLGGEGVCEVIGANSSDFPFKAARRGGGNGVATGVIELNGKEIERIMGKLESEEV